MKAHEQSQRRRIAKLRLAIKELRRVVCGLTAHVRMQDDKIALLAWPQQAQPYRPYSYRPPVNVPMTLPRIKIAYPR